MFTVWTENSHPTPQDGSMSVTKVKNQGFPITFQGGSIFGTKIDWTWLESNLLSVAFVVLHLKYVRYYLAIL